MPCKFLVGQPRYYQYSETTVGRVYGECGHSLNNFGYCTHEDTIGCPLIDLSSERVTKLAKKPEPKPVEEKKPEPPKKKTVERYYAKRTGGLFSEKHVVIDREDGEVVGRFSSYSVAMMTANNLNKTGE